MGQNDALIEVLAQTIAEQVTAKVSMALSEIRERRHVQPVLLSVKEAGIYIGRSEQAVQHLVFQRDLPVVRVGRRVHLDRRDLDAWIEKNKF